MNEIYKSMDIIKQENYIGFIIRPDGTLISIDNGHLKKLIEEYHIFYKNLKDTKYFVNPSLVTTNDFIYLQKTRRKVNPYLYLVGAMREIVVDRDNLVFPLEYTKEQISTIKLLVDKSYIGSFTNIEFACDYDKYIYQITSLIRESNKYVDKFFQIKIIEKKQILSEDLAGFNFKINIQN